MRQLGAAIFAVFCLAGAVLAASELNLAGPAPHWAAAVRAGSTRFINTAPLNVSLKDFALLAVSVRTSSSGVAELYWAPARDKFSPLRNYPFYVDGRGRENLINLAAYTRDGETTVNHFFIVVPGSAEIAGLKLVKGGPWQLAAAGWQEFFGPLSRTADGLEFLVIRSPRLFGRPFLSLLNALLFACLLIVLLLRGKWDLRRAFLVLLLAGWGLVELNSLRNNWLAVQRDARYLGRPLEVKQAMMNEGDFYAFLKFAERELPAGSVFDVATSHLDYNFRAAYYLYPDKYLAGGPYLLVYDLPLDKKTLGRYRLWKVFRPGAALCKL